MLLQIAKHILAAYAWLAIGLLFYFLWRIAAFYERASGQRVGHRLLLVPGGLFAAGVLWYLWVDSDFVGHPVGDLLLCGGGILLLFFSGRLAALMTGGR